MVEQGSGDPRLTLVPYRDDRDVLDAAVSLVGPVLDGIALRLRVPDQRGFLPLGAQPVTPYLAQADLTLLLHQRIRIVALVQLG